MKKKHRIFIAINLPEDIKRGLVKYQEKWSRSQSPDKVVDSRSNRSDRGSSIESGAELPAKWTVKDNLHITLEFLGDLTDEELGNVCKVVGEVSTRHKIFSVNLNKILYGPPKKNPPRMVWVEGEKSDELADLKEDLQECLLDKIQFRPEGIRFSPHITLARIKEWEFRKIEPEERPEIDEYIDLTFTAESIDVMESELKRGGPQYTILESAPLQG